MKNNPLSSLPLTKLASIGLAAALTGAPHIVRGTTQSWDGGSVADGNWGTAANWNLDGTPPINNQEATFSSAIANTWGNSAANPIGLGAGRAIRYITVTGNAGSYFIGASGGGALTMSSSGGNGGLWQMQGSLATSPIFTINAPVVMAEVTTATSHRLLNDSASGTFVINGNLTTAATTGTSTLLLQGTNTTANTIAGNIGDNGAGLVGITKNTGNGTWILSGTNSYTGATVVAAGTLLINGTHNGGNTNGYDIGASGVLGGTGTVATASLKTAAGSKLTPGGTGVAEDLSFSLASGIAKMDISASSNGTGAYLFDLAATSASDKIVLTLGTLDVGAMTNADFVFTELAGFGVGKYVLFDAVSAITGSVTSLPDSISFSGGRTGALSIDAINNDIILTVVPEPAAYVSALGGIGVILLLRLGRRLVRP